MESKDKEIGRLKKAIMDRLKAYNLSRDKRKEIARSVVKIITKHELMNDSERLRRHIEALSHAVETEKNAAQKKIINERLKGLQIAYKLLFGENSIEVAEEERKLLDNNISVGEISEGDFADEGSEEVREIVEETSLIGRVCFTPDAPATPREFSFWTRDEVDIHVELGQIVTVRGEEPEEDLRIVGIVEDVKAITDVPSAINEFYSSGMGQPEVLPSVRVPTIRQCRARVVCRSDNRVEPVIRRYRVYHAQKDEIVAAYSGNIDPENRVLLGFTYDWGRNPVPVYGDFTYMFGYKGAHVNIAGTSGLATKTSYALFLLLSALSHAERYNFGAVAFNVKERDLLDICSFRDRFPDMDKAIAELEQNKNPLIRSSAELWRAAVSEGVDPFNCFTEDRVTVLNPGREYKFGLQDLINMGEGSPEALRLLFDPEDINDNLESLLIGIVNYIGESKHTYSFDDLINFLRGQLGGTKQQVTIGGVPVYVSTVAKFIRRMEVILEQLSRIIDREQPSVLGASSLGIHRLEKGQLVVINIEPLPDRGKRLVFLHTLRLLHRLLEYKKEGMQTTDVTGETVDLTFFPDRVAVFVDELNKFAPSGRTFSPIKGPIIDITARGRSLGLSLIGAEQLASQVDGEVVTNCSTHVVGRIHPVELANKVYGWIGGNLKDRVGVLRPGEMLLMHSIHNAPVLIYFPVPLHLIGT